MAQIRNISGDTLTVPHLNKTVGPDELLEGDLLWPDGLAADTPEGLTYAAAHPDARVWPATSWVDVGAPPPVGKAAPAPVTPAPSE